jgi:hypothetical protein
MIVTECPWVPIMSDNGHSVGCGLWPPAFSFSPPNCPLHNISSVYDIREIALEFIVGLFYDLWFINYKY